MRDLQFTVSIPYQLSALATATKILTEFMNFRRISNHGDCKSVECPTCSAPHLNKIVSAVQQNLPVRFVLPAFPGKSPNPVKVLGTLPDFAERLALHFLGTLCARVKDYYAPGIKIILCSDGRVFSDVVGIKEQDITAYQNELGQMIEELDLSALSTFNLDDVYETPDFAQMRNELMRSYGVPLETLQNKIRNGGAPAADIDEQEANRMYCGITRFLLEDSSRSDQTRSRTSLQKEARTNAYEVIRRSNAWSELIAEVFPDAVRLSIHPQSCGSKKLGLRLIGNESWMTPWHGVAVETVDGFVLLKRSEAEALGAELLFTNDGKPSHFRMKPSAYVSREIGVSV